MNSRINDTLLDELVCGDLSPERYREILRLLDSDPDRWRDCAIAFLQEQAIESEMKSLASGSVDWDSTLGPASEREDTLVQLAQRSAVTDRDQAAEKLLRLGRWTSLAALLMVSFTIGWVGSGALDQPTQAKNENRQDDPGSNILPTPQMVNPNSNMARVVNPSEQYLPLDRRIPEWLVDLERSGVVRIESSDGLVPMQLENGKQVVIPTQMYRVVKNGQSY